MGETEQALETARRYIIKRPRLTRLLDGTNARVLMLIAPAGFGKTTLAREWAAGRPHCWYRGTTASADVAALAAGLSEAVSEILPDAGERMIQRMRAIGTPEEDVRPLAEIFSEDLTRWPDDTWLVIDDYQFAMEAEAPERFVDLLLKLSPIRLLLTSRKRPTWASSRRMLYGEVYELGRSHLAMSQEEAEKVLAHLKGSAAPALVALADGWPAVIGLAALTEDFDLPEGGLPETLYEYFAEELYQAASPEVQRGLCRLALAPTIGQGVPGFLLAEQAEAVVKEGLRLGFLTSPRPGHLELHPLLRTFLDAKSSELPAEETADAARRLTRFLGERERWDDAFSLLERFFDAELFEMQLELALPSILREARLSTLIHWLKLAESHQVDSPVVDLAEAELAFRQGLRVKAETFALQAARRFGEEHPLASHCLFLAGSAAHIDLRDRAALDHHRRALAVAKSPEANRDALWGQLLSIAHLETEDYATVLQALLDANDGSAESEVRMAHARFVAGTCSGDLRGMIETLEPALHLLSRVRDPLIRSSFLATYAQSLVWAGHYEEALSAAEDLLEAAEETRLDFAVLRGQRLKAMAEAGLRNFARAASLLERLDTVVQHSSDPFLVAEIEILKIRLFVAQGLSERAIKAPDAEVELGASDAELGEYLASRALALACVQGSPVSLELVERSQELTRSIEVQVLNACTRAVQAIRGEESEAEALAIQAFNTVTQTGNADCFVCAYRGFPSLLRPIAAIASNRAKLGGILQRARDESVGSQIGLQIPRAANRFSRLSPREREVCELLAQGLKNREIAKKLFVSEATAKVHVRRILEKLGVRTRTEAALVAAAQQDASRQPAPQDSPSTDPEHRV